MAKRNRDEGTENGEGMEGMEQIAGDDFEGLDTPDDDFKPLGTSGPQAWVVKGKGVEVRGILLSRFAKQGKNAKKGFAYTIRLTKGGVPVVKNKVEQKAGTGAIVCIDESKAVEDLRKLADDTAAGAEYEVVIQYGAERGLDDGNTFWPARIFAKANKPRPAAPTGDRIPF